MITFTSIPIFSSPQTPGANHLILSDLFTEWIQLRAFFKIPLSFSGRCFKSHSYSLK